MKYILIRLGKDKTWKECKCRLYVGTDRTFSVFFDKTTPEIGLNDNKFHSFDQLKGTVHNICVDEGGISINGFVKLGDKWHEDGFRFRFDC